MNNYTALVPMGGQFEGLIALHEIKANSKAEAQEIADGNYTRMPIVVADEDHPELYGEHSDSAAIEIYKSHFVVYEYLGEYFGICKKGTLGGICLLGGDSANEDDYNEEYINDAFNRWNGALVGEAESGYYIEG